MDIEEIKQILDLTLVISEENNFFVKTATNTGGSAKIKNISKIKGKEIAAKQLMNLFLSYIKKTKEEYRNDTTSSVFTPPTAKNIRFNGNSKPSGGSGGGKNES